MSISGFALDSGPPLGVQSTGNYSQQDNYLTAAQLFDVLAEQQRMEHPHSGESDSFLFPADQVQKLVHFH